MHRPFLPILISLFLCGPQAVSVVACDCGRCGDSKACVPACKSSWEETKTRKPSYSLECEYACGRDAERWCTGPSECRCSPPCGSVYVKKKLYKQPGDEKTEKVPKYEVTMVPAEPCDCARCCGVCWWNPLSVLHYLIAH